MLAVAYQTKDQLSAGFPIQPDAAMSAPPQRWPRPAARPAQHHLQRHTAGLFLGLDAFEPRVEAPPNPL
jgi:hypothetical protein